jgi:hypothetical protein
LSFFSEEFWRDVNKGIIAEALLPVIQMAAGVVSGTVMLKGAIVEISLDELLKGVKRFVLVKFELTGFDLPLGVGCPVLGFLLAFVMVADRGVALDADDCTPDGGAVCVFALVNGCHIPTFLFGVWIGWRCWLRLFFNAPPLHRKR